MESTEPSKAEKDDKTTVRLVYNPAKGTEKVCDWTQYVLQLRVIQPASNLDSNPALVLSVPLTADVLRSTKLAIVGPAQSASQVIEDTPASVVKGKVVTPAVYAVNLKFKFPIYNPPSDTSNVCLGDALGNFFSEGRVLVVRATPDAGSVNPPAKSPDETGKPTSVGTVEIEIAAAGLPGLLDNKHLFLNCSPAPEKAEAEAAEAQAAAAKAAAAAAKTAAAKAVAAEAAAAKAGLVIDPKNDLGPLIGMRELISPTNVQLSISGTKKAFYQFSGNNLDFVTGVLVGTNTTPAPVRHTEGGLLVDLSSYVGTGTDALLRFAIDDTELAPLVLTCPAQTPAPAAPKDKPAPAAATTNTATVQVTNVTNVNTAAAAVAVAGQTPGPADSAQGGHKTGNASKTGTGAKKKGAKSTSTG